MNETLELPLTLPKPKISAEEVEQLVTILRKAEGWMTALEVAKEWGRPPAFERHVRKVASAAAPVDLSYPGSPGYLLMARCTLEEVNHCIDAFESQGRELFKRAATYRRALHSRAAATRSPVPVA